MQLGCRAIVALLGLALLGGCTLGAPVDGVVADPAVFADLPGWSADHLAETLPAMRRGCMRLTTLPADQRLGGGALAAAAAGQAALWTQPCAALARVPDGDDAAARRYFEAWFTPHQLGDGSQAGLFTGYYEPLVAGATVQGGPYQVALLARPDDLVRLPARQPNGRPVVVRRLPDGRTVPYYTRAQIAAGALDDQDLAIVWLKSRTDLFFLQLQGSGRIVTPGGVTLRVAYDGQNGQPYVPVGRLLAERGQLAADDVSMQSIRGWLAAHPGQADALLNENPDYVFFRQVAQEAGAAGSAATVGPPGALGVPLTPGRSVAVDRTVVPLGAPVFIATDDPLTHAPWRRLTVAQDLGTDINGAARADIFYGSGAMAEAAAGRMHAGGSAWVLLPRQPAAEPAPGKGKARALPWTRWGREAPDP